jgi:hypothetical protein
MMPLETRIIADRSRVLSTNAETEVKILFKAWPSTDLRDLKIESIDTAICLVFDCSSSMLLEHKLETAIESANMIVDIVPESQKFSFIAFGSKIFNLVDNVRPTADAKESIKSEIASLPSIAGGSTNMGEALRDGIKVLRRSKSAAKVLILLSDGAADFPEAAEKAAEEAAKDSIQVFAVGIGAHYEAPALLKLVKFSNGAVFGDADTTKIKEKFNVLINRVESFVITNAKLDIMFHDAAQAGLAYKASPEQAFLGNTIPDATHTVHFNVGNIERDKNYAFLVITALPQWDVGPFQVCSVKWTFDVPSQELKNIVQTSECVVEYTKNRKATEDINGEVLEVFRRANITQLAERFVEAYKLHQNEQCAKYLRILSRRYDEIGDVSSANHYKQVLEDLLNKGEISNEVLNATVVASTVVSSGGELPSVVDDSF